MRGDTQDASARLCVARPHRWDEREGQSTRDWGTDLHSIQVVSFLEVYHQVAKLLLQKGGLPLWEAKLKMKTP